MNEAESWAGTLGLTAPIVCAPMGGVAGGRLAAAVSRAGALGMIGMGSSGSALALRRELAAHAEVASGRRDPWGIGMVAWGIERDPEMLEVALAAEPTVVSVSFGDFEVKLRPPWIDAVHRIGAQAVCQVATPDEARLAADAGVDVLVARGKEAGGHGVHLQLRERLLTDVLAAVDIPVLSAGAIHLPGQVVAALAAGASGVWVGTAFEACTESLINDDARRVLFAARGEDTMVSRVADVALKNPWPEHVPERVLRTEFVERWQGREQELAEDEAALGEFRMAVVAGDYSVVPLNAGEGVTALVAAQSAAQVVASLFATQSAS
ncbi:MAG: NAD(P)H-dependent flavin oxidoreductase [Leucobacter sp.]